MVQVDRGVVGMTLVMVSALVMVLAVGVAVKRHKAPAPKSDLSVVMRPAVPAPEVEQRPAQLAPAPPREEPQWWQWEITPSDHAPTYLIPHPNVPTKVHVVTPARDSKTPLPPRKKRGK